MTRHQSRLTKLDALYANEVIPYAHGFTSDRSNTSELADMQLGASVSAAGRITSRRVMGKLAFFTLSDESGQIQLYIETDQYRELVDLTDLGDWIGVHGILMRTQKGELSIKISSWQMLSKALQPLPDKWHGLADEEKRYRQRYLDMATNPGVREVLRKRSDIILSVRNTLNSAGFIEVETPVLHTQPGGADARPFETHHNALDMPLTLRIATELHLKRLVVGGFERVYELGRIFRNEGTSTRHNPEFTSVEIYQAYADYYAMIDLAETLISNAARTVCGGTEVVYDDTVIDFSPCWRRATMHDLVRDVTGLDFNDMASLQDAVVAVNEAGLHIPEQVSSVGELLLSVFEQSVEKTLIQPTFVMDYPVEVSPLARPHRSKPGLTERYELFIAGMEIANAYSELIDPVDQRRRFEAQQGPVDEDFLHALEVGMPPTGGLGIGIDRLVMLLTNNTSIREVIAFPLLRPQR